MVYHFSFDSFAYSLVLRYRPHREGKKNNSYKTLSFSLWFCGRWVFCWQGCNKGLKASPPNKLAVAELKERICSFQPPFKSSSFLLLGKRFEYTLKKLFIYFCFLIDSSYLIFNIWHLVQNFQNDSWQHLFPSGFSYFPHNLLVVSHFDTDRLTCFGSKLCGPPLCPLFSTIQHFSALFRIFLLLKYRLVFPQPLKLSRKSTNRVPLIIIKLLISFFPPKKEGFYDVNVRFTLFSVSFLPKTSNI